MPQTDFERLVYQMSSDVTALKRSQTDALNIVKRGTADVQGHMDKAGKGLWTKFLGHPAEVDKAVAGIFSRSRLAVLEEGGARIPIFGSALEALGPAGLAGAAGLAAVAIAGEQARKAMEWADELDRTAKSLGVTTDYLQELDYAAISTSVGWQKAREGAQSFEEVIGKFSTGAAPGKVGKILDGLGITPDSVRDMKDFAPLFEKIMRTVAAVPNQPQRAGLAKAFGLEAFLPVLSEGTEGVDRFLAKMREARTAGGVVSASDIQRAAEMQDHVEALTHLIQQEFRAAFIELAPTIEKVAEFMELVSRNTAHFIAQIPAAVRGMIEMASHVPTLPGVGKDSGVLGGLWHGAAELEDKVFGWRAMRNFGKQAVSTGQTAELRDKINESLKTGKADFSLAKGPEGGRGLDLANHSSDGAAAARKAEEARRKAVEKATRSMEAVDSATRDELSARGALASDIQERADLAAQEVDADLKRKNDKLKGEIAEGKIAVAAGERAITLNATAATEKKLKLARDAEEELAQQQLQDARIIHGYYDQVREVTAALARTMAERRDAELALLGSQHRQEVAALEEERTSKLRGATTQGQRDGINSRYDAIVGSANDAYTARQRQTIKANQGPLDAWKDDTLRSVAEVQEALERAEVKGWDAFNDGAATAIANGESLGDVMHSVFVQMETDLIRYLLKQAEIGIFGGEGFSLGSLGSLLGLGHNAAGTSDWTGGATVVGENGPEIVNLPQHSSVVNHVQALAASSPTAQAPIYAPVFHLEGAVMTSDILRDISAAEARATMNGAALGAANAKSGIVRAQGNRLGR